MLFSQVTILLAALAASAQAGRGFTVPRDTPAGSYMVTYDEDGNAIHTKLEERAPVAKAEPIEVKPRSRLFARADSVHCGDNREMNHSALDAANDALDRDCNFDAGKDMPAGADFYRYDPDHLTIAYVCNRGGQNHCNGAARREASARITSRCGAYKPGWVDHEDYKLSYGYDHADHQVCGRDHPW